VRKSIIFSKVSICTIRLEIIFSLTCVRSTSTHFRQHAKPTLLDLENVVDAPISVMVTQFPFLYMGNSKAGFPVCYFDAGKLCVDGWECVTKLENLQKLAWYMMVYVAKPCYINARALNSDFVRYAVSSLIS